MCQSQLEAIGLFCCDADENEGAFLFTSSGTLVEKHGKKYIQKVQQIIIDTTGLRQK
jgi:hypothetical protein